MQIEDYAGQQIVIKRVFEIRIGIRFRIVQGEQDSGLYPFFPTH